MKVLLVAGASGGHIFPALGLIDQLRDNNADVLLVLPKKSIKDQLEDLKCNIAYICVSYFSPKGIGKNLSAAFNLIKGFIESVSILARFKPDVVVGFGSMTCFPVVITAWFFRIKTVIHEQNVIPGRANRLLAIFADKIAVSFPETAGYLKKYARKISVTGNPLRRQLNHIDKDKALAFFGLAPGKFTIMVVGGSQGSRDINQAFIEVTNKLSGKFAFQVIHICGNQDYDSLNESYKKSGIRFKLFGFLNAMQYAYSAADLVICRCGATTISEIIFYKLPAIIIPYPYAYEHQMSNAKVLENSGCARIIKNEDLESGILKPAVESYLKNAETLVSMRLGYGRFVRQDQDLLLKEVLSR